MADLIGLLRFGMPQSLFVPVSAPEAPAARESGVVVGIQGAAGGSRASSNYSALPRPVVSPQFAFANAADDSGGGRSIVISPPEPFDTNVIPGPPPTFKATLLELESHLRMSLARLDATRHAHPMEPKPVRIEQQAAAPAVRQTSALAVVAAPGMTSSQSLGAPVIAICAAAPSREKAPGIEPTNSGAANSGRSGNGSAGSIAALALLSKPHSNGQRPAV